VTDHPPDLAEAGRSAPSRALLVVLAAGFAVVPCLFATGLRDVFAVPKLTGLWLVLVAALLVVAAGRFLDAPTGTPLRWTAAVDVALVSFLVLNVLAAAASTDRRQSLFGERLQHQGLLTLLLYAGLFLLARHVVFDVSRLTLLFAGITAGAIAVATYAIVQRAGLDPIWDGPLPDGRVFSSIGQPNALAAYLVLALPPAAFLARIATGARRAALVVATGGIVAALVLTLSRGGLVALVVMAILAVGLLRRRRLAAAALVAGAAAGGAVLAGGRDEGGLSTRNHLDSWHVAARIALDHPFLGTGQETFPDVFPRYSAKVLAPERAAYFDAFRVESAHNVYLTMAAGTGILSLLAYVALIIGTSLVVVQAARATGDQRLRLALFVVVVAAAGHVATDAFLTAELTGSALFWTLLGAGTGMASRFAELSDKGSSPSV
jgi:O-antigen ligase